MKASKTTYAEFFRSLTERQNKNFQFSFGQSAKEGLKKTAEIIETEF